MVALEQDYGYPYRMSAEEFLVWQRDQDYKHEFVGGITYAMAGASYAHNHLTMSLGALVLPAARAAGCRATQSDMALYVAAADAVYYPDVMVACGELNGDREQAPCLVIEVMSPSTQGRDRTVKLAHYSSLPSLRHYLMVSSDPADQFVIEHRWFGGAWRHLLHLADHLVELSCPEVSFAVRDLYVGL